MSAATSFLALCRKLFAFSLLSRLLGLARDLSIAWLVGAGASADLLAQALRLPHIFRRLLAEGSLSLALTAVFVQQGAPKGRLLFWAMRGKLLWLLGLLLPLALLCLWPLALLFSASVQEAQKLLPLLALALPYVLFAVMAALSMSYLHARRSFSVPACSPLIFNGLILLVVLLAAVCQVPAVPLIVLGVSLGGLAQWLWQEWPLHGHHKPSHQAAHSDPNMQAKVRAVLAAWPTTLLAASMPHLALLCAMVFLTAYGPGQVSALFYAERILELPLGLIGVCLGMAALPNLSLEASRGHFGRFTCKLERALHMTVLLILPAMTGLWAIAAPLISLLFGHGHFATEDLPRVTAILVLLLPLLPAQALGRVLLSACMALDGRRLACAAALVCLFAMVLLSLAVHPVLAAALGLAGHCALLWLWLARVLATQGARPHFSPSFLLSALGCALVCALCARGAVALARFWGTGLLAQVLAALVAGLVAWLATLLFWRKRDLWRLKVLLSRKGTSQKK